VVNVHLDLNAVGRRVAQLTLRGWLRQIGDVVIAPRTGQRRELGASGPGDRGVRRGIDDCLRLNREQTRLPAEYHARKLAFMPERARDGGVVEKPHSGLA